MNSKSNAHMHTVDTAVDTQRLSINMNNIIEKVNHDIAKANGPVRMDWAFDGKHLWVYIVAANEETAATAQRVEAAMREEYGEEADEHVSNVAKSVIVQQEVRGVFKEFERRDEPLVMVAPVLRVPIAWVHMKEDTFAEMTTAMVENVSAWIEVATVKNFNDNTEDRAESLEEYADGLESDIMGSLQKNIEVVRHNADVIGIAHEIPEDADVLEMIDWTVEKMAQLIMDVNEEDERERELTRFMYTAALTSAMSMRNMYRMPHHARTVYPTMMEFLVEATKSWCVMPEDMLEFVEPTPPPGHEGDMADEDKEFLSDLGIDLSSSVSSGVHAAIILGGEVIDIGDRSMAETSKFMLMLAQQQGAGMITRSLVDTGKLLDKTTVNIIEAVNEAIKMYLVTCHMMEVDPDEVSEEEFVRLVKSIPTPMPDDVLEPVVDGGRIYKAGREEFKRVWDKHIQSTCHHFYWEYLENGDIVIVRAYIPSSNLRLVDSEREHSTHEGSVYAVVKKPKSYGFTESNASIATAALFGFTALVWAEAVDAVLNELDVELKGMMMDVGGLASMVHDGRMDELAKELDTFTGDITYENVREAEAGRGHFVLEDVATFVPGYLAHDIDIYGLDEEH